MEVTTKKLTYQEFREIDFPEGDNAWYELINGLLVRKQSPTLDHQNIADNILIAMKIYARKKKLGKAYSAPLDTVLDDGNSYHPDVLFVSKERYHILDEKERVVMGAPDLVVEVLSKSTAFYDRGDKKDVYEKCGVREYWLIDQKNKTVEIYAYENQRFKLREMADELGEVESMVLDGFKMKVAAIFED
ncbi:MAG: Uma2 family endonuclease [Saprospiraceae bacterium]